jgi:glycosyltransferase involved in cell wall biosynthesis
MGTPFRDAVTERRADLVGRDPRSGHPVAVVNGRFLDRPVTGVERYAREVALCLGAAVRVERAPDRLGGTRGHLWEQCVLPSRLQRGELLWSPANTGPLAVREQVVTIHDTATIDHPEWFRGSFARYYRFLLPRLARRALQVITSSRFSRDRLVKVCGVPADRVTVIHPGVDPERFRPPTPQEVGAARARYALPERYVLAVGSRSPRKNLTALMAAWELLRRRQPGLGLVIVGDPTPTNRSDAIRTDGANVRVLGRVTDGTLSAVYGGASVFAYPSLYEGFGLPVLEAMACGTPVVAAERGGLPEAVGDAGALCEPANAEEMARVLEGLVEDGEHRRRVVASGLQRARELTWERTAARVLGVLQLHRS